MFRPVIMLLATTAAALGQSVHDVTVDTSSSPYSTDLRFLSLTLNTIIFHRLPPRGTFEPYLERIKNLAKALSPLNVRIGGVRAGLLYYQKEDGTVPIHPATPAQFEAVFGKNFYDQTVSRWRGNWNVTGEEWSTIMDFLEEVGWDVTFNLNQFTYGDDGIWDPTNFRELLAYSESKGHKIESFQLINEPNGHDSKFDIWVTPEKTAQDFQALRDFLDSELSMYSQSGLIGPDVTSLARHGGAFHFLRDWILADGHKTVDALSVHQYYFSGRLATLSQFLDVNEFESQQTSIDNMRSVQADYGGADLPIIITESANAWSGGAQNLSNAFCSTFLFLDQLATCAKNGVLRLNRQDFHSGYYGLLDEGTSDPNPDYWLSLLYKQLVVGPVLSATVNPVDTNLKVYAHCARRDVHNFRKGAIVVYYLNVNNYAVELDLSQFSQSKAYLLYQLTSINGADEDALKTNKMLLNGQLLQMTSDEVPEMVPVGQKGGNVAVEAYSLGFVVINSANVKLCK